MIGDIHPWEVHIRRQPERLGGEVIIFRRREGEGIEVLSFKEDGTATGKTYQRRGEKIPPTMIFFEEMELRQVIQAFMQAGREFGMPVPDETFAKGKLEAMDLHLQDMRKIVFEPQISGVEIRKQK